MRAREAGRVCSTENIASYAVLLYCINGKRTNLNKEDLMAFAKAMNIKKPGSIISEIHTTVQNWTSYADDVNVNPKQRDSIQETLLNFE